MRRGIVVFVLTCAAAPAWGGGLFVGESGTQAMERGGAFVAKADDPSALWLNPAGLVKARRFEAYLGSSFLDLSLTFKRSGVYEATRHMPEPGYVGTEYPEVEDSAPMQPVPALGLVFRWRNLGIGVGVHGPQGVPGRDFTCDVEENCLVGPNQGPAPNRYDLVSQEALVILTSLGVAYRVHPMIDIGVRGSVGFGSLKARSFVWGVRNHEGYVEKDGDFALLDVSDSFMFAFGGGVLVRPLPALEIGLAYSSKVTMNAKGNSTATLGNELGLPGAPGYIEPVEDQFAACAPGGTTAELKACVDLTIPQTATFGVRWKFLDGMGKERGDIELDVKWENWSAASDILVTVDGRDSTTGIYLNPSVIKHGFEDVFAVRLGGSFRFPVGANVLETRAGLGYDTAAAPVSWNRVDMDGTDRFTIAGGVALELGQGRFRIDAGFGVVLSPARDVEELMLDEDNPTPIADRTHPDPVQPLQGQLNQDEDQFNAGHYESGYIMGMVGLTAAF